MKAPQLKVRLSLCLVLNILLFCSILFFFKPLFNSGDDAFLMYSFSGAFGVAPTELVDYSWGWHFLFGLLIKQMFVAIPSFNWYSFFLLVIHFLSCVLIFDFLLRKFKLAFAFLIYAVFFVFFEVTFLFSLSFTNTSIMCAAAGNLLLMDRLFRQNFSVSMLVAPLLVSFASGLLRFHAWALVELIFAMFIFLMPRSKGVHYIISKVGLASVILVFYLIHQAYYRQKIPGWQHQQNVSGVLINFYNSPHRQDKLSGVFRDSAEAEFLHHRFFYDSLLFTDQRIKTMVHQLKRVRSFSDYNDWRIIYWTIINSRVYLLCLAVTILFLFAANESGVLKKASLSLTCSLLLYLYLLIFKKVTGSIYLGLLLINWLVVIFLYGIEKRKPLSTKAVAIFAPLLAFGFFWMCVRIYKMNSENVRNFDNWICHYNDLKRNPSVVHVASDNNFPIDYFSISDNPRDFAINNFISIAQFPKTVYYQKKNDLKLTNVLEDISKRPDVSLVGVKLRFLEEYYLKHYGYVVSLAEDTSHYQCSNVYKVLLKQD